MATTSYSESGIVINVAEENDTLTDIVDYISQNIDKWAKRNVLWDVSRLNLQSFDSASVRLLISQTVPLSRKRSGLKTAILVASDIGYGMMRMLQILSEEQMEVTLGVFRSKDEAMEWLSD